MAKIVAIQMDPIENIQVATDTTFALMQEAQRRQYRLFYYTPRNLSYKNGVVQAKGYWLDVLNALGENLPYKLGEPQTLDLSEAKVVLIRQDPPFDLAYITTTHLLDCLPITAHVINNPTAIRNAPEKLIVNHFPDLMAPTLITRDEQEVAEFLEAHQQIILKPLHEYGGRGVMRLTQEDGNLPAMIELFKHIYTEPFMVQPYLAQVQEGDKRIVMINGKAEGIYKRIPPQGQARSNVRVGGKAVACTMAPRDQEICERLLPFLRDNGLYLVGIDVIGPYLTEINVTSPTGIPAITNLYNRNLAQIFWQNLEEGHFKVRKENFKA